MESMLRRRIPRALAVTAVALLVFGSGAGFAAGGGDGLPEVFQVAPPRGGDRWVYETDGTQNLWTWDAPSPWRDGNGTWHAAQRLSVQVTAPVVLQGLEWVVGATTGRGLAFSAAGLLSMSVALDGPIPLLTGSEFQTEGIVRLTQYWDVPLPCGVRTPFQDVPVDVGRPVRLPGCADAPFHAVGFEEAAGSMALRLHAEDGNGTTDLWFSPAVPVPVRVARVDAEGDAWTTELVGFEPGTEPLDAAVPLPAVDSLPPLESAERPPWGMDDEGVDLPFRLSEAWAAARDAPLFSDFRGRLAEHPELHAVAASRGVDPDGRSITWAIRLSDDEAAFMLFATRTYRDDALASLLPYEDEFDWHAFGEPVQGAPEQILTAQSLLLRWNRLHPDEPGNTYGFSFNCALRCEGDIEFTVGRGTTRHTGDSSLPGGESTYDQHTWVMVFDGDGTPVESIEAVGSTTYKRDRIPGTADVQMPPGEDPHSSMALASPWTLPTPPARAGIAGAALLVGLLYWLWPALKSGGFVGLFSRLRRERLLEHPTRVAIVDAVRSQPGIHHTALVRMLGKGKGVVDHHLRKLDDAGLVVVRKSTGRTCYFVRGAVDAATMDAVPHLGPAAARVLAWVVENPGQSATRAARAVGISDGTMSHHVRRLRGAGLLRTDGGLHATHVGGRAVVVAAT